MTGAPFMRHLVTLLTVVGIVLNTARFIPALLHDPDCVRCAGAHDAELFCGFDGCRTIDCILAWFPLLLNDDDGSGSSIRA